MREYYILLCSLTYRCIERPYRRLRKTLRECKYLLLWQKAEVYFPAPMSDGLQTPVFLPSGVQCPFLAFVGATFPSTYPNTDTHAYTQKSRKVHKRQSVYLPKIETLGWLLGVQFLIFCYCALFFHYSYLRNSSLQPCPPFPWV